MILLRFIAYVLVSIIVVCVIGGLAAPILFAVAEYLIYKLFRYLYLDKKYNALEINKEE